MEVENKLKILTEEVKNLQEIIKRMATNSLEIKKWTVALVISTLILKFEYKYIAFIPLIAFWILDSYYLRQERLFRKQYEEIIATRMHSDENFFNVNPEKYKKDVKSTFKICFSVSTLPFYGSIFIILIFIFTCNHFNLPFFHP
ncbi:hypothetical protein [Campylobacter hyointestinalis]|uniref:Uncharacterized protein n=1 Tax=Campylobacter hyointestinalis subsp. lawsonii TaxID=91353 RepID=A0AAV6EHA7_CAMHY|nr:hypothetical protein [Campylobacter hyointestinalis]KAB0613785.1 hypothetical protein F7P66_03715 [Campylobacter hyointestinalis subsp. lawsonii]QKF70256.1 hypothetical protein CHLWT_1741 [Campylobacter hyointestinalis subsp. lawsonii]RAZ28114.1 hypothetical protein CHLT_05495 [Campylobacter hyointestinalis subsp. lawsonii]RAZ51608.1 hypothetical protein CHL10075_06385 [Campylobacter hyointestinalis subsp. lawsonii]